jgi:hypothetical protein
MDEFLQRLGMGNATELTGNLVLRNVGVNTFANVGMNFFIKLQRVNVLNIVGSSLSAVRPLPQSFAGFPGFEKIEQAERLVLNRTSFPSFRTSAVLGVLGACKSSTQMCTT